MSAMTSQINAGSIFCSTVCSGADQRKHQSVTGLCGLDFSHKGQETRKCFHLMTSSCYTWNRHDIGDRKIIINSFPPVDIEHVICTIYSRDWCLEHFLWLCSLVYWRMISSRMLKYGTCDIYCFLLNTLVPKFHKSAFLLQTMTWIISILRPFRVDNNTIPSYICDNHVTHQILSRY